MYVMEAENMKVAEFIQKVYVASYQLTRRMDVNYQHAARKEVRSTHQDLPLRSSL
jgi:hypothetical protein